VSIASMIVPRWRGTFRVPVGFAKPSTSAPTAASISTAEMCRCQPGRRGATDARRSTLVKRSA